MFLLLKMAGKEPDLPSFHAIADAAGVALDENAAKVLIADMEAVEKRLSWLEVLEYGELKFQYFNGFRGGPAGDIGHFLQHRDSAACELLIGCAAQPSDQQPPVDVVKKLVSRLGGCSHAQPTVITAANMGSQPLLSISARQALMQRLDTAAQNGNHSATRGGGSNDLKLDLSKTELNSLIGAVSTVLSPCDAVFDVPRGIEYIVRTTFNLNLPCG